MSTDTTTHIGGRVLFAEDGKSELPAFVVTIHGPDSVDLHGFEDASPDEFVVHFAVPADITVPGNPLAVWRMGAASTKVAIPRGLNS